MLLRTDVGTQRPVRYPCPCNGSRRDAEMGNSERRLVRVRFNSVMALAVCKNKKQIKFLKKTGETRNDETQLLYVTHGPSGATRRENVFR